MIDLDALVLGGGPAGAAASLALRQKGFRTALVEPHPQKSFRVGETIPPAFKDLLQKLDVSDLLDTTHHLPSLGNQSAWGRSELGYQDFFMTPQGNGWHLDRVRFEADLLAEATRKGVHLFPYFAFDKGERTAKNRWQIKLKANENKQKKQEVHCSWVIDATGREARFAHSQGVKHIYFDKLVGIGRMYTSESRDSSNLFTLIEATPEGWWYLAALPRNRLIAIFMTDSSICKAQKLFQEDNWLSVLAASKQIAFHLQQAKPHPPPENALWVMPASTRRLSQVSGTGWIAVGDAAFSMDPLSSAGIYKAIHHGLLAASTLYNFTQGDAQAFSQYDQLLHTQFENYLADKRRYYRQELRWSQNPFWQQRHETITLDPTLSLSPTSKAGARPWTRLNHLLPESHWQQLWQYCKAGAPAHQIIGQFMEAHPGCYAAERLIQALAYLMERGLLEGHPLSSSPPA